MDAAVDDAAAEAAVGPRLAGLPVRVRAVHADVAGGVARVPRYESGCGVGNVYIYYE